VPRYTGCHRFVCLADSAIITDRPVIYRILQPVKLAVASTDRTDMLGANPFRLGLCLNPLSDRRVGMWLSRDASGSLLSIQPQHPKGSKRSAGDRAGHHVAPGQGNPGTESR
jgi:hypothetical protein